MRPPIHHPPRPLPPRPTPDEIAAHRPYHRLVRRILLLGGVRGEADVEDRQQNVFMAVLKTVGSERAAGREVSSMEGLFSRVAVAQAAEHHRDRARRGNVGQYDDEEAVAPDSQQGIPTPRRAALLKERAGALELLLERMEPELRAPFILVDIEEMRMQQTADLLSLPYSTVRWRVDQARKRFEALMGPVRAEIERGERRLRRA
jgi:RNA polymerase sigma factor (sigma-70 family)